MNDTLKCLAVYSVICMVQILNYALFKLCYDDESDILDGKKTPFFIGISALNAVAFSTLWGGIAYIISKFAVKMVQIKA